MLNLIHINADVCIAGIPIAGLLDSGAEITALGVGSEKFVNLPGIQFYNLPLT